MVSSPTGILAQDTLNQLDDIDSRIVEHFRSQLLSAKRSMHQNHPWVMVASIDRSETLLSVYNSLKSQGFLNDWSGEFFNLRQDTGVCVLALMP